MSGPARGRAARRLDRDGRDTWRAVATRDRTPDPPRSPRRLVSRQQLLDAAREIVTEHGYRGASVAAIAGHAGISNGALYRHFPSKVELFVEVFRDVCEREIRAAQRASTGLDDPLDKLDAILANFANRALGNPKLAWALIAEPVDPAIEEVRLEYRRTYRRAVEQLLRQATAAGTIPAQDTEVAAAALIGAGNEVLAGPLSPLSDRDRDLDGVIATLRRMSRGAIGAAGPPLPGQTP